MANENSPNFGKNALEWSVFGLSLALISGVFGVLGFEAFSAQNTPPKLEIQIGQSQKFNAQGAKAIEIRVENRGQTTARGVEIEVSTPRETASFSLDYVPREGQNEGFVVLEKPFESGELRARVKSFTQ